jgi:two-component system response regulator NreC
MSKIRLLLVDDHQVVRAGLRMLFMAEDDLEIVGEASNAEEAITAARELDPDVILMDVVLPGLSGIEATRRIKKAHPDTHILALTMHEDEQYFFEMLQAGATGYVPKRAAPDDLLSAIRAVSQGNVFLYPTLAKLLVKDFLHRGASSSTPAGQKLTPREIQVLTHIAEGSTNREIAAALVISVKTVDRHRENIMRKLDLHSRVALVKYAIAKGLIDIEYL